MIKKKTIKKSSKKAITKVSVKEYAQTLLDLKKKIQEAQIRSALAANKELLKLYWAIGQTIARKQKENGWGSSIIERLAKDLQNTFPGIEGFSPRNISRMRSFYLTYQILPQAVAELEELPIFKIPWGHNAVIIEKIKDNKERLWYAQKAIEYGWSRSMLETWIESNLYRREGKAITNFSKALPSPQSDIAQQSLKDPYVFDFLTLKEEHAEHDLEQGLIDNVQKMLLEFGNGFSFVARQYHLEVGKTDFYIDLLFYHYKLRCFIVVELKARKFDPRDAGQLNFYLSAVDDLMRQPDDKPTIGILLCKTKDNIVAEYALRDINKPIGIAGYEAEITKRLPKELKSTLPSVEEIESELEKTKIINKQKRKRKISRSSLFIEQRAAPRETRTPISFIK